MTKNTIIKRAFINAVCAAAYIALVAIFMPIAGKIFGPDDDKSVLGPMVFLMTFVISTAVMAMLIFGKPILLYLDGLKKEAVSMIIYTIASLILIVAAATIAQLIIA
ncbi:MAG: hypothetical protein WC461_01720 [Candidatus Paceibacterota bacterium]